MSKGAWTYTCTFVFLSTGYLPKNGQKQWTEKQQQSIIPSQILAFTLIINWSSTVDTSAAACAFPRIDKHPSKRELDGEKAKTALCNRRLLLPASKIVSNVSGQSLCYYWGCNHHVLKVYAFNYHAKRCLSHALSFSLSRSSSKLNSSSASGFEKNKWEESK